MPSSLFGCGEGEGGRYLALLKFAMLFTRINSISGLSRLIQVTKTTDEMPSMLIDVWESQAAE